MSVEEKITFKEYIQSKQKLVEKAKEVCLIEEELVVNKYCKLPTFIIKSKLCEEELKLKPNDVIICQQIQRNNTNTIRCFFVAEKDKSLSDCSYFPKWNQQKLQKWIVKNTSPAK